MLKISWCNLNHLIFIHPPLLVMKHLLENFTHSPQLRTKSIRKTLPYQNQSYPNRSLSVEKNKLSNVYQWQDWNTPCCLSTLLSLTNFKKYAIFFIALTNKPRDLTAVLIQINSDHVETIPTAVIETDWSNIFYWEVTSLPNEWHQFFNP